MTGENFDSLEASLNTDLDAMGLSRDSSYIIVIHGEPAAPEGNPNARVLDPPTYEDFDGGGSSDGSYIFYSEHGSSYRVRQITITAADDHGYMSRQSVDLLSHPNSNNIYGRILNYVYTSALDDSVGYQYGTILELLGFDIIGSGISEFAKFELNVGINRTRIYTQIFDEDDNFQFGGRWFTFYGVESASVHIYFDIHYYDPAINRYASRQSTPEYHDLCTPNYLNTTMQNEVTVDFYLEACMRPNEPIIVITDVVGDIGVYITDEDDNSISDEPVLVFPQYHGDPP